MSKKIKLSFIVGLSAIALMACSSPASTTNTEATSAAQTSSTITSENDYQKEFDRLVEHGDVQVSGYTTAGVLVYNDDTLKLLKGRTQFLRNGNELTFALSDKYVDQLKKDGKTLNGTNELTYPITTLKEVGKVNNIDQLYQILKDRLQVVKDGGMDYEIVADRRMRLFTSYNNVNQLDRIEPSIIIKTTETDRTNKVLTNYYILTFSVTVADKDLSTVIDDSLLSTAKTIDLSEDEASVKRENGLGFFMTNLNRNSDEGFDEWLKQSVFLPYND